MSGDFEWAVVSDLANRLSMATGLEVKPVAGVLPVELPDASLQSVNVGGAVGVPGVAYPALSLHIRACEEQDAVRLANAVPGAVWDLSDARVEAESVNVVHAALSNLPYANFDPVNPDFYRYSCQVVLTIKINK